mmetsp:Transcript_34368/g.85591  ORF Transcript_34368/g.85591 Transcript_34368/m.85591 type:complete len:130 (-) Transcript_34368:657-1046(-)
MRCLSLQAVRRCPTRSAYDSTAACMQWQIQYAWSMHMISGVEVFQLLHWQKPGSTPRKLYGCILYGCIDQCKLFPNFRRNYLVYESKVGVDVFFPSLPRNLGCRRILFHRSGCHVVQCEVVFIDEVAGQ